MAAQIGSLHVRLGANTAQFEAGMKRAQVTARATGQNIERSFAGARAGVTRAISGMQVAMAGLAAIGGSMLGTAIRGAFDYAANLGELSRAMGVTVEQYQILNRAAIENGFSMETAQRAIAILNRTLGEARAGSRSAVEAFRSLGIPREQLDSFRQAGDVLPRVMESIRNLRTQSEQAAAAQRLFGRSAAQMLPFLTQGADGWDEYSRKAREAGLITAEQARVADDAADQISVLAHSIKINLASAVVGIIPMIRDLVSSISSIASAAAGAFGWLQRLAGVRINNGTAAWAQRPEGAAGGVARTAGRVIGRMALGPVGMVGGLIDTARNVFGGNRRQSGGMSMPDENDPWVQRWRAQITPPDTGDIDLDLSGGGGGGRARGGGGGGGGRSREQAIREEANYQSEIRRHQISVLQAMESQERDYVDRNQLSVQILDLERQEYVAQLDLGVQLKERTAQQAAELLRGYDAADEWRRHGIAAEQLREVTEERQELADAEHEQAVERLRLEADSATTAAERRQAELRLLELTYEHQAAKLLAIREDQNATHLERERARIELDGLQDRRAAQRSSVIAGTRGPMEDFLSRLPTTAAQANEALQAVAANGLQAIEDGLVGLMDGTKSVADAFSDMAKSIIADLIRIQIQRMVIAPLANALGGMFGGPSGGTDVAGSMAGSMLPFGGAGGADITSATNSWMAAGAPLSFGGGRAAGGPVIAGRMYLVGEEGPELIAMGGNGHVIPNNKSVGGNVVNIHQNNNFAGGAATMEDVLKIAQATKAATVAAIDDRRRRAG